MVRGHAEVKHVQERMATVRSLEKRTRQEFVKKPSDSFERLVGGVSAQFSRLIAVPVEETAPIPDVQVGDLVRRLD